MGISSPSPVPDFLREAFALGFHCTQKKGVVQEGKRGRCAPLQEKPEDSTRYSLKKAQSPLQKRRALRWKGVFAFTGLAQTQEAEYTNCSI